MTPSAAIEHLISAGMTEKAIGAAVGAGQSTINRIRHGRMQPAWAVGDKLVRLAKADGISTGGAVHREEHGDNVTDASVMCVAAQRAEAEAKRLPVLHGEQHCRPVGSSA